MCRSLGLKQNHTCDTNQSTEKRFVIPTRNVCYLSPAPPSDHCQVRKWILVRRDSMKERRSSQYVTPLSGEVNALSPILLTI